jgi:hypothetical protein
MTSRRRGGLLEVKVDVSVLELNATQCLDDIFSIL